MLNLKDMPSYLMKSCLSSKDFKNFQISTLPVMGNDIK